MHCATRVFRFEIARPLDERFSESTRGSPRFEEGHADCAESKPILIDQQAQDQGRKASVSALDAAKRNLATSGISANIVDLVTVAATNPDVPIVATATKLHRFGRARGGVRRLAPNLAVSEDTRRTATTLVPAWMTRVRHANAAMPVSFSPRIKRCMSSVPS
jgi:hypothetical protein